MSDEYCTVSIKDGREIEAVETTSSGIAIERTSQGHSTTRAENVEGLSAEDKKLQKELGGEESEESGSKDENLLAKIQKVPTMLQDTNTEQYFKPRALVIGPLHHGTSVAEMGKKLKVKMATKFIKDSGKTVEHLLQEIKNNINELKERFDENVIGSCSDEALATMLFLDGCSILQFTHSFQKGELNKLEIKNGAQATLIQQDLFLLENQIPFKVLELLMKSTKHEEELRNCVQFFVFMNTMALASPLSEGKPPMHGEKQPVHLLDYLRSVVLFELNGDGDGDGYEHDSGQIPCFGCAEIPSWSVYSSQYGRSFRNVQDLKAAGIKFKPSNSRSLKAISFSTRFFITGQLELPPLIVDDSTVRKLWNLVAFEMCPDNNKGNFGVTSYLSFLDSLIDTEQDVKDLRSAHIIRNRLNSDAEVAELFNKIGSNLVPDKPYLHVNKKIQRYYERRSSTWMAQVSREHFRNPSTIMALLGALTLLLLTAIQAWCAVYPKK